MVSQNPVDDTSGVVEITPNITCQFAAGGKIVIYTLMTIARAEIDTWVDSAIGTLLNWPSDQPYLAVHDLSSFEGGLSYLALEEYNLSSIAFTASGMKRVDTILQQNPALKTYLATILPPSLSGRVTKTVLAQDSSRNERLQQKFFFNRQAAKRWLEGFLQNGEPG